jgi:hypothetical protein
MFRQAVTDLAGGSWPSAINRAAMNKTAVSTATT